MHDELVVRIQARSATVQARLSSLGRAASHVPRRSRKAKRYAHPLDILEVRSHAIVAGMAELEGFVRETILDVHHELNRLSLPCRDLRPCLRQLVGEGLVQSLRDGAPRHDRTWDVRRQITTLDSSLESARFPVPSRGPVPPLDGRTMTALQISRIWRIYELPGDPVPEPKVVGHLKKLAAARNDLAHANYPLPEIFRAPDLGPIEVVQYLESLRNIVAHKSDAWATWLSRAAYI